MSTNINTVKNRFGIVGFHPRLISAIEIAIQVAPTNVPVLIQGENGTGKDVFARIIHQYSRRKHETYLPINTGAIPEGTMDSELFGHEKGAFTGSIGTRKGYFEEVDGGSIFLDEIGEMPMPTQQRLLRLLENREYLRVGSSKVRTTDVRVIAATNKNLIDQIRRGKFREDLYFRLNTVSIVVPPLRDRGDDIELLFQFFSNEFAIEYRREPLILTEEAADLLNRYRWPGNVRELKNFVEKLTILHKEDVVTEDTVREHLDVRESYLPGLPVSRPEIGEGSNGDQRREIEMLYRLIMDLRDQVDGLKKMIFMGMQGQPGLQQTSEEAAQFLLEHGDSGFAYVEENDRNGDEKRQDGQGPKLLEQPLNLEQNEKDLIIRALKKHQNNRKKAAQELGISERTLYRKIKQFGI